VAPEHVHPLLRILEKAGPGWTAAAVFSAVVLAPLAEELFFRGLLQSLLRRRFGPWPAVLTTAAVFAAVHYSTPQAVPALAALGIVLGYNYERTGRLFAPILLHAIFNALNIAVKLSG
jgi:hypothetical protein